MIASDRKYLDPTLVLSSIVDDYGNELAIGDQKDIGEFNLVFLSRIEDGFEESRK
jgi:ubiquitin carboxyl-terminal hydrolase 25/28